MKEITNADDIVINISGNTAGGSGSIPVDSFDYSDETEATLVSGCGNHGPIGVSKGNATGSIDITITGEEASVMNEAAPTDELTAPDMNIHLIGPNTSTNVVHFWPTERTFSGSDGDAVEYNMSGVCAPVTSF